MRTVSFLCLITFSLAMTTDIYYNYNVTQFKCNFYRQSFLNIQAHEKETKFDVSFNSYTTAQNYITFSAVIDKKSTTEAPFGQISCQVDIYGWFKTFSIPNSYVNIQGNTTDLITWSYISCLRIQRIPLFVYEDRPGFLIDNHVVFVKNFGFIEEDTCSNEGRIIIDTL